MITLMHTQVHALTRKVELQEDEIQALQCNIDELEFENETLSIELGNCQMDLATIREDMDRLMDDGARKSKALADLQLRTAPVIDLVTPPSSYEDIEDHIDRLPALRKLVFCYHEGLMKARLEYRAAAKRKRAEEESNSSCIICCDNAHDCTLPCPGRHRFCQSCVARLDAPVCPVCRHTFDASQVAYDVN